MNVLRALVAHPQHWRASRWRTGRPTILLTCWARRAEPYRPVGFGIGTTWDKLQYPFVQYQLLKTMDTLTQVPGRAGDPRYQEMVARLGASAMPDGCWLAEGVNKP